MSLQAIFFATICILCLSIAPVFMKKISAEVSAVNAVFMIAVVTLILSGLTLLFFENKVTVFEVWLNKPLLIFILIISGIFFIESLSYVKALQAGAPIGLLLVYIRAGATAFTPVLGILLFQEKITPMQWIGIALACLSIFFIVLGDEGFEKP